jgi:hypothetical protein
MKLELDAKEVEAILLGWADTKWPGQFNQVKPPRYEKIQSVEFSYDKPESESQDETI